MPETKVSRGNRTERRGHRPPHVPTDASRKQVEALASFGVPQENIATVVEVGEKTLRKYYADVLATAEIKANSLVAQSLFNKATKGEGSASVTAAIFWLKTRARWKETSVHEHNGQVVFDVTSDCLSAEAAWEAEHAVTARLAAATGPHRLDGEE